mgnify:CR=1 FL=1|jgi:agmatinase
MKKSTLTFLFCDSEYSEANTVIFGAPFDGTTSFRPGTRFAPQIMRQESYGLEVYSPYQNKELTDKKIFDAGDLVPAIGNVGLMIDSIYDFTKKLISDNKLPIMIGGEHSLSVGTIKAVAEKYPDMYILHFDAHTDLRDVYYEHKLSHANVLYRAWEILGDQKIFQFGIRSGAKDEFEWAKNHVIQNKYNTNGLDEAISIIKNKPVYITIDYDVLDPAVFPGTGTPEPGGISFHELLNAVLKFTDLNVVGADVVELSPHYDPSGASTAVACKILRELLIAICK